MTARIAQKLVVFVVGFCRSSRQIIGFLDRFVGLPDTKKKRQNFPTISIFLSGNQKKSFITLGPDQPTNKAILEAGTLYLLLTLILLLSFFNFRAAIYNMANQSQNS